ncbi:Anthranilate synthase component 2 [Metallosphaera sp. J1]|uniref:aminodeoxychorismate/anthranilate synthase component II n=1 Tax=Metallosphaera javensis (ex Hofmann et al. 2022) TaxID=99938 RepID=UPI001EDF97D9|nr:aminodeoxychorismate/anthranilate synthase component II [Metallosphaera javensis (ex Hofmann et al. 2022)]MCG3108863.1 Anthranilate synthase component 2 [Metallosphaera javensis (ex Hofmann et al. 2022)]
MDITLIIDNYDSFVYNIAQSIGELGSYPLVVRNDEISVRGIERLRPDRIVISPGPGSPEKSEDVGIVPEVIRTLGKRIPILGVCLGHQAIGYTFGARIRRARVIYHGKLSTVVRTGESPLYTGLPTEFRATRYHSLVVDNVTPPLAVDSVSKEDGEIMGLHHVEYRIYGVQFHPESVGTTLGQKIFYNFLNRI